MTRVTVCFSVQQLGISLVYLILCADDIARTVETALETTINNASGGLRRGSTHSIDNYSRVSSPLVAISPTHARQQSETMNVGMYFHGDPKISKNRAKPLYAVAEHVLIICSSCRTCFNYLFYIQYTANKERQHRRSSATSGLQMYEAASSLCAFLVPFALICCSDQNIFGYCHLNCCSMDDNSSRSDPLPDSASCLSGHSCSSGDTLSLDSTSMVCIDYNK
jgi:hypothetical protein